MKLSLVKTTMMVLATFAILLIASCYPDDDLTYDQTDVVITNYDDTINFTTFKTYFMSDTVYPVRSDTSDHSLIANNAQIIDLIAQNMQQKGYTRITEIANDTPDVRVSAAAIMVTTVQMDYWYPYYPGWGWGWDWGWGWKSSGRGNNDYYDPGYPGYYYPGWWGGYPYYSSYTTGTLLVEMANPNDVRVINSDSVVPIYWASAVSGILSSGSNLDRIEKGINKAFEMSPEIKTN